MTDPKTGRVAMSATSRRYGVSLRARVERRTMTVVISFRDVRGACGARRTENGAMLAANITIKKLLGVHLGVKRDGAARARGLGSRSTNP